MQVKPQGAPRHILRKPAVKARIGIGADSTLYDLMAAGRFPRPINIGARAVGWIESEVEAWITDRMLERDAIAKVASHV
jgi:prophage regulatory protein